MRSADLLPAVIARAVGKQRLLQDKRLAEEALLQSEERYRTLVEFAPYAIVLHSDGEVVYANPTAVNLLRVKDTDAVLGRSLRDFFHPDSNHQTGERTSTRNGVTVDIIEDRIVLSDETLLDVEVTRTPVMFQGRPAVQMFIKDITAQRQAERERRDYAARLKDALVQTIQALALTIEKRDPFTAGHQRRVAALAAVIGRRMGLPDDRVDGIYMGGLIHDIGKIYVPTAILNRPSRLSRVEYDLLHTHAEVGYDIIKGVSLPWPVDEMVLQHHERFDGTGYPRGLKGEEILLDARIISVADVVEAMASHRPYRPSLGLELALAEVETGSGRAYDPAVVAACLKLFREEQYRFE